jgi:hypothetical protein
MLEERMRAELVLAEKKIQMEKEAKGSTSKLPELKISPFVVNKMFVHLGCCEIWLSVRARESEGER